MTVSASSVWMQHSPEWKLEGDWFSHQNNQQEARWFMVAWWPSKEQLSSLKIYFQQACHAATWKLNGAGKVAGMGLSPARGHTPESCCDISQSAKGDSSRIVELRSAFKSSILLKRCLSDGPSSFLGRWRPHAIHLTCTFISRSRSTSSQRPILAIFVSKRRSPGLMLNNFLESMLSRTKSRRCSNGDVSHSHLWMVHIGPRRCMQKVVRKGHPIATMKNYVHLVHIIHPPHGFRSFPKTGQVCSDCTVIAWMPRAVLCINFLS